MGLTLTFIAFFLSLLLSLASIPPIIRVARAKNLFEPFGERKVHTTTVPPLGGVAIFIAFIISTVISTADLSFVALKYIIAATIMMFFIGLKDDLIIISARKKFIIQGLAAFLLIVPGGIQLTNLHGLFGIGQIPGIAGILLTLFVMLTIVNAWNLIDGIDGLASGLAIFASVVFGSWFLLAGHYIYTIMSFALAGSLSGFFAFNVFGMKNKLFMGDAGSLIIGLIISVLVIKFNELNIANTAPYAVAAAPAVSFAVLAVPLLDTLRVIVIRLSEGRSPFSPDKNHTHHRLLKIIPRHLGVTATLIGGNAVIAGIALWFNRTLFNINLQFLLVFCIGISICLIPSVFLRLKKAHHRTTEVAAKWK